MVTGLLNVKDKDAERRYPRLSFIRDNPEVAALISKLVPDPVTTARNQNGDRQPLAPSDFLLSKLSNAISSSSNDTQSIFQLLPDMELARQILVSSILSPKDLVNTELNFRVNNQVLPSEVSGAMLNIVREHFENIYKIKQLLPKILSDALFMTGSYPMAILPENSIDEAINSQNRVALESIRDELDSTDKPREIGLLGTGALASTLATETNSNISLENYAKVDIKAIGNIDRNIKSGELKTYITVTDNFNSLKMPGLYAKLSEDRVQDLLSIRGVGLEAFREENRSDKQQNLQVETSLYRTRQFKYTPLLNIKTKDQITRPTIGHPLIMKLPSESIIPVHVPSNPEDHIGYYVLLDETGNPISTSTRTDYFNQMQGNYSSQQQQMSSQLLSSLRANSFGQSYEKIQSIEEAVRAYTVIVENDLVTRLRNGVYGNSVEIARPSEVYRVMFARTLAKMNTQILYIPASLVTYFAFDYNEFGIGTSLIEDSKILASIRAMLLFSNTMASIKNSIGRVGVKIGLSPQDPNPTETVEILLHEYSKNRQASYPLGVNNPRDIVSYLQNAAVDVNVSGNAGYPETTFDVDDKANNHTKPDTELEETLKKRHIMSMGLAPETIDLSMGVDFATSVVSSNLLLAKRVLLFQEMFCVKLSEFISKYTLNSGILTEKLREVITEHETKIDKDLLKYGKERLIIEFVGSIETSLPAPDSITLENQMKAFQAYKEALELAIDSFISSDFLEGTTLGELSDSVDVTKNTLKAYFLRKWLAENNVLPELAAITSLSEDGEVIFSLLDENKEHIEGLARSLESYMKEIKQAKAKRDARIQELNDKLGTTDDSTINSGGEEESGSTDFSGEFGEIPEEEPLEEEPLDESTEEEPMEEEEESEKETEKSEESEETNSKEVEVEKEEEPESENPKEEEPDEEPDEKTEG